MNGPRRKPPDKHKSDVIMPENDSILVCEMVIKEEPNIKQEPDDDDDIVTVSRSTGAAIGMPPNNWIGDRALNDTNDFSNFGDSTEAKVEHVKEEANRNICKSSDKKGIPQNNAKQNFSNGKNQKSSGSNGVAKKKASQARKKPKAKRNDGKKKSCARKVNRKQHKCSKCDYVIFRKDSLNRHMVKHTDERPHSCTICPKRFKLKQTLEFHMKTHVDEFMFSCSNCQQGFDHNEEKVEHEANCTIRRYECHLCKEYSTLLKTHLGDHLRVHHTGEKPFKCDRCSKKFVHAHHLKDHRKTHTNPRPLKFKCSVCFKNFKQQIEIEKHEANCKRVGYKCDLCKSFTTNYKANLVKHMRIHTGEKPFRCELCSKYFTQNMNTQFKCRNNI